MNPNIPSIDQLKEMALPTPVSYAPQTWGWWALLAIFVLAVLLVSARRYWQWRRDRYRREALARLAELQQRSNDLNALRELPELLKRVALSMPPSSSVGASLLAMAPVQSTSNLKVTTSSRASSPPQESPAALGTADWQAYLQRHSKQPLPADFSQQLALLAYAPDATLRDLPNEQRQALFNTCKTWVERHHVAA
ncbi:DUF4381 domain-containing protein [Pseudomonas vancouverensis]|uniref:DUF4381 domain-containing protein n=1 Tax=Pseudomonas vancouverensis TaxID=95300 RepID=A0A1H2NJB1_PSEVA|nr:DUF4381 domain-containing protein [Pseudomonas vancouverensis]KAB0495109.1 DUF4381 domain-containing protein [Pseudomonas vancouverensis]TDB63851.1 DUF4381 domain-containing protein [Pseudomonas vancouverensis]SDV05522.1 protein of unknown function [Pseudomonas vancouverensis]